MSDTNILSSFTAGDAFPLALQLFARAAWGVPPSVQQELQAGLLRGKAYLEVVLEAIDGGRIAVFTLSNAEELLVPKFPQKLNLGEREALALAQVRRATLLSNDKRAVAYCQQQQIRVVSLVDMLRLLWTRQGVVQDDVRAIIAKMQTVENLTLTAAQYATVFASAKRR